MNLSFMLFFLHLLGCVGWSLSQNESCTIPEIPGTMNMHLTVLGNQLRAGEKIQFSCRIRSHSMSGKAEVECLPNGQWSSPFPTCGAPKGCGRPSLPADADFKQRPKDYYVHNERAEFMCPNYYIMDGGPFKTCDNSEWVGEIRCLRPCTVDAEDMNTRNIRFRFSHREKLYASHDETISFACSRGRPADGEALRQTCRDGVMDLPTCQ